MRTSNIRRRFGALLLGLVAGIAVGVPTVAEAVPAGTYTVMMSDAEHPFPIGTILGTRDQAVEKLASAMKAAEAKADTEAKAAAAKVVNAPASGPALAAGGSASLASCRAQFGNGPANVVIDRFNYCHVARCGYYTVVNGEVTGLTSYRCTTSGRGSNGNRETLYEVGFDNFVDTGSTNLAAALQVGFFLSGGRCNQVSHTPSLRAYWQAGEIADSSVWSNPGSGSDTEDVTRCTVDVRAQSDIPGWGAINTTKIRHDSTPYNANNRHGAIFDGVTTRMVDYSRTSSAHGQVAEHIYFAQSQPQDTIPWLTYNGTKSIPGSVYSAKPLTRLAPQHNQASTDRYTQNRSMVSSACAAYFGVWNTDTTQCDEYPFASTYEGAAGANGNYSIRLLDKTQNLSAGGTLVQFYHSWRIIDGDPFFVDIG
ncbi:NucA/NucB deoxyribonuclease domain-containing protein [Kitasatospora sp. NPDC096147]|uniref:NucA/NucB deoxyribonuclease domain-containing protein n=1 Tax=Kitasatospora sp. NPDC096147 TaxID=3364093 RepID=UPI003818006A